MLPVVFGSFFRVFSCTRLALFPVFFWSFSVFVLIEAACFSMYVDELSLASHGRKEREGRECFAGGFDKGRRLMCLSCISLSISR